MIFSMIIIGILWFFLFPWLYRKSIKDEAFAKEKQGRLHLPHTEVKISDGVLTVTRDEKSATVECDEVTSVAFTDRYIYVILQEEKNSLIIPYSALTDEQMQTFSECLNALYGDKVVRTGGDNK